MRVAENMGDHAFAAWLRERGAIKGHRIKGTHNEWRDLDNKVVAIVTYDNSKCTRVIILDEEEH